MRRARLPRQKFNSPREFLKRHSHVMGARRGRSLSLPLSLSLSRSREREIPRRTAARLERIIYCVYFVIIYYTLCIRRLMHICVGSKRVAAHTHTRARAQKYVYLYHI